MRGTVDDQLSAFASLSLDTSVCARGLATALDDCGFVVDFSSLRPFEEQLRRQFDHTFLVNRDDPLLADWQRLHDQGALDLRVMENVGMEATAALVWEWANVLLKERDGGRTCCLLRPAGVVCG